MPRSTTEPGYVNRNDQEVVRRTNLPGNDYLQYTYALRCGTVYGAKGCDIWLRRCPACQQGRPGLPLQ